ncbi:MAG: hypothetical protein U0974_02145 [Gemmatimonadales bacterium]|nr:hypothetical protein [Gemmatimonadales bacterium]
MPIPNTPPALRRTLAHVRIVGHAVLSVPKPFGDHGLLEQVLFRAFGLVVTVLGLPMLFQVPSGLDPLSIGLIEALRFWALVIGPVVLAVLLLDHWQPGIVEKIDRWLSRPGLGRRWSRGRTLCAVIAGEAALAWGAVLHFSLLPAAGYKAIHLEAAIRTTMIAWIGPQWPLLVPFLVLLAIQLAGGWILGGWLSGHLGQSRVTTAS